MKLRYIAILGLLVFTFSALAQGTTSAISEYNLKNKLALEGYDPVSYFDGKPLKGKAEIKFESNGVIYWFNNYANLSKFKENPSRYEPVYGGWCAFAMGDTGEKVKIDPETFKVIDNQLYLFYNFWGTNTLKEWNKNEKALKLKADQNWKKIIR